MRGNPLRLTVTLAKQRAGAHLNPTIWRSELAYDTGTHGFGRHTQTGCFNAR